MTLDVPRFARSLESARQTSPLPMRLPTARRQSFSARRTTIITACLVWAPVASAVDLQIISVEPAARSLTAATASPIVIHFDKPVNRASFVSLRSFWAFGRWSGTAIGTFAFSNGDRTVTLVPDRAFSAGENVMVILSHDIAATDGTTLRAGGYSFQFWTATQPTPASFTVYQRMSTRGGDPQTTAYGGIATDLNGDGFLDVTIVNETTADLRVYLNRADDQGTFNDFLRPTFGVGMRASPSEPSDFNRDGIADICVANINDNSVSVLLGNGDGTFAPQQRIVVGNAPRGIVVLDADGDGDTDIVNTNFGADNLSLLTNDGTGAFGAPTFFEGGGTREWALAAADMTNDGLLDLVIGTRASLATGQRLIVDRGNGNATFTTVGSVVAPGWTWMLVCGDVNGDGNEDVAAVHSNVDRGSITLGDGAGGLLAPVAAATDPFPIATDLGDLDGDGDLDWVTSSFAGDWVMFTNDAGGAFSFARKFASTAASSCALLFDADNDNDLDLALVDEIADEIIFVKNSGSVIVPTASTWGLIVMALLLVTATTCVLKRRTVPER